MAILIKIDSCKDCPKFKTERTEGAGYAIDWLCSALTNKNGKLKVIAGYIEWSSEEPKDIPTWCPYRKESYNKK